MEQCSLIQVAIQTIIVVIVIFGLGVKLERRITKIETDVKWLKKFLEVNGRALQYDDFLLQGKRGGDG